MADRVIIRELINLIGVEVDPKSEESVNSFLGGIEAGVNRAGKFFFFLGELLEGVTKALDVTVGALFRLVTGVAKGADEMRLAAESAGVSTASFQELAYAASTVGGEMGSVGAVLLELSKKARMVSEGNEQASTSFARLGVSTRDASGNLKAPNELLLDVADALAEMPPGAKRSALAFEVLGAQGTKLLPVLSKGRAGLAALAKEGRELGVVLDDDVIRASDEYMTELGKLEAAAQGLRNTLAGPFLKVLTKVITALTEVSKPLRKWIGSKAVDFVEKLTWAMENSTKVAEFLYDSLLLLTGLMLGRMLFALSALTSAQLAWGSAALISGIRAAAAGALAAGGAVLALLPWLALGAAIILIAEEIASFFTGADSALKRFIKYLDSFDPTDHPLLELFKAVWSLIFDITDTQKWSRLFSAIGKYFDWFIGIIKDVAKWLGRVIGETTIEWGGIELVDGKTGKRRELAGGFEQTSVGDVASGVASEAGRIASETRVTGFRVERSGPGMAERLGSLSQQPAPMESAFGRGGSTGSAMQSVASSQAGPTVFSPVFNLQQEVNASPGQSAAEVGQAAAQSGEDLFSRELQRTLAAYSR